MPSPSAPNPPRASAPGTGGGIRLKLLAAMLGLILLLGAGSAMVLRASVLGSFEALEREALVKDVARLFDAMDAPLLQLDEVTREWSQWSEMATYAESRDKAFEEENLSPAGVAASQLALVAVFDLEREPMAVVPDPDVPAAKALADLLSSADPFARQLRSQPTASGPTCGLVVLEGQALMQCRRRIYDTEGQGPARGVVLLARAFDNQALAKVVRQTRLELNLRFHGPTDAVGETRSQPLAVEAQSRTLREAAIQQSGDTHHLVAATLQDMRLDPVGTVLLNWPRDIMEHGKATLWKVLWQGLALGGLLALAMLVLTDRWLVARLRRLGTELSTVTSSQVWSQRVNSDNQDEIGDVARSANALLAVIEAQVGELEAASLTDSLTRLANRRQFDARLSQAVDGARRGGVRVSLALFDIDHFKPYNDRFGHPAGDGTLQAFARCLTEAARRTGDLAARYGGEEFALLMEHTDADNALRRTERVLDALRAQGITHPDSPLGAVSASAGVTQLREGEDMRALLQRADEALYEAKRGGRGRAVLR